MNSTIGCDTLITKFEIKSGNTEMISIQITLRICTFIKSKWKDYGNILFVGGSLKMIERLTRDSTENYHLRKKKKLRPNYTKVLNIGKKDLVLQECHIVDPGKATN